MLVAITIAAYPLDLLVFACSMRCNELASVEAPKGRRHGEVKTSHLQHVLGNALLINI